ncbi:MAG: hypothetical protein ISR64_06770 [Deltaproteobacteria bacterium]|nr:hypothetical protein [Deltaproteobacteria bacterium]
MNSRLFRYLVAAAVPVLIVGCSSGTVPETPKMTVKGKIKSGDTTWEQIDTGHAVEIAGVFSSGDTWSYEICVQNPGIVDLEVDGLSVDYDLCVGDTPGVELFRAVPVNGATLPALVAPEDEGDSSPNPTEFCAELVYTRDLADCEHTAELHILNDSVISDFVVSFSEKSEDAPHFAASPEVLDLGIIKEGSKDAGFLSLLNTGLGDLVISEVRYRSTADGFNFQWGCEGPDGPPMEDYYFPAETIDIIDEEVCSQPVVIPANSSFQMTVNYGATDEDPAKAFLTFVSNDPLFDGSKGEGLEVEVWANVSGPCLKAIPAEVSFGSVVIADFEKQTVTLESCGDKNVEVTGLYLTEDSSADFGLDLGVFANASKADPVVMKPGEKKTFSVTYLPPFVDKEAGGTILEDTGMIHVENSSVYTPKEIPVNGTGVAGECPVAEFMIMHGGVEVKHGDDVLVESTLDFIDQSYDPTVGGGIVSYEWSVSGPSGSADVFDPSPTFPSPQFTANVVGDYLFRLKVFNKHGIESCAEASKLVHVKAGEGCHVELTWNTPNDPDPTDQCFAGKDCGTDLDLHVVHPYASTPDVDKDGKPDGFFDTKYDCFWFNPHPIWVEDAALDPLLQPHLDLDDTDGAGPENFNYVSPEVGKCYKVGVHYWDDHGFGASYPKVKMFIDGDLVYEKESKKLKNLDMWEVGEACCADKANPFIEYTKGGDVVIINQYINPDFNFTP